MNRKQRRAGKKKNHDPAYFVRQSDIVAHVDRLMQTDEVSETIKQEVRRANLAEVENQEKDIIALFLWSLHLSEHLGRKRLLRVAMTLTEMLREYQNRYEDYDRDAIRLHLKERVGIDVEFLDEEISRYVKQQNTIEG